MRLLVTGGAGFIGSNFVHRVLKQHPDYEIAVLDKLTYAGRKENLQDVWSKITFVQGDITRKEDVEKSARNCDCILNFAAETHVDRSIIEAGSFVETDVLGTYVLLEATRKFNIRKYVQVSTDEVYGSIREGSFSEESNIEPNSPYSASKAGGDLLVRAYNRTYNLPTVITRSSNNYGPYQYPEKIIPLFIINLIDGKKVPVYGDGMNVRDWLYVLDNCEAIDTVLQKGNAGEVYNIGGNCEKTNLELTKKILEIMGKSEDRIEYIKDRLGHDRRYSLDSSKVMKLGWQPKKDFDEGLKETVKWYASNERWWRPLKR